MALADEPDTDGDSDGGISEPAAAASDETSTDGDSAPADDEDEAAAAPAGKVDPKAVMAAIEAKDTEALLAALGDAADDILGGKAHKSLRLQLKDVDKRKKEFEALGERLQAKYGDPVAARKAAAQGTPEAADTFIDMVEKWAGTDWNSVQRWLAQGLAGRPGRLEAKTQQTTAAQRQQTERQQAALNETKTWISTHVKKAEPELADDPEVVELMVAEMKVGLTKGIDTPAKALPLVKKKLKAKYDRLHKVFGAAPPKGNKPRTETPAARANRSDNGRFVQHAPATIDESVQDFLRKEGLS